MASTAHFDASGSPDATAALVVGGYVSSVEQWVKFDEEWKRALSDEAVDCFHMKEFAHSVGRFKEWRGQEARRRNFISRLIGITARRVHHSFGSAGILDAFKAVNPEYPLAEAFGNPYPLCGETCLIHTSDRAA